MTITAVAYQVFRLSYRLPHGWTIASPRKRFFHLSSIKAYIPDLHFKTSQKGASKLRLRDGVPNNYELIYKSPMELTLRVTYPVILCTIFGTPVLLSYKYYKEGKLDFNKETGVLEFSNPQFEFWVFSVTMVLGAWAVLAVAFKYPFRVYKHNTKQEYIAMFLSGIPLMLRRFHFERATPTKFVNPIYYVMEDRHFYLDEKKGFLLAHYFRVPADLFRMMGDK